MATNPSNEPASRAAPAPSAARDEVREAVGKVLLADDNDPRFVSLNQVADQICVALAPILARLAPAPVPAILPSLRETLVSGLHRVRDEVANFDSDMIGTAADVLAEALTPLLARQADHWRMSSVCREKQTEIDALTRELYKARDTERILVGERTALETLCERHREALLTCLESERMWRRAENDMRSRSGGEPAFDKLEPEFITNALALTPATITDALAKARAECERLTRERDDQASIVRKCWTALGSNDDAGCAPWETITALTAANAGPKADKARLDWFQSLNASEAAYIIDAIHGFPDIRAAIDGARAAQQPGLPPKTSP